MIKELNGKVHQLRAWMSQLREEHFPSKSITQESEEETSATEAEKEETWTGKVAIFWAVGLGFVILGYLMYQTMEYLYLLIAAYVISLALEGVVAFFSNLTRRRGLGVLIAYLLFILFLTSGFIIVVPFLLHQGTEILSLMNHKTAAIQQQIAVQGVEGYLRSLTWLPEFIIAEVMRYMSVADTNKLLQTINNNIGSIVAFSSVYLKLFGAYAMNILGWIFAGLGKVMLFFMLSLFFSLSHFQVKNALHYAFRRVKKGKEKIDEVYGGLATWLKAQLLMCLVIGVMTYLGMGILHLLGFSLPQKATLAVLAGVFEVLPYL